LQGGTRTYWYIDWMLLNAQIQNSRFKSYDRVDEAVPAGYGGWGSAVIHGLVPAPLLAEPIKDGETNKVA